MPAVSSVTAWKTMIMLSSKGKGVSMDIRLPILDNLDKNQEEKAEDENDGQD